MTAISQAQAAWNGDPRRGKCYHDRSEAFQRWKGRTGYAGEESDVLRVQFVAGEGEPGWKIAGISIRERTRRALARAGIAASSPRPSAAQLLIASDALLEPGAVRSLMGGAADPQLAVAPAGGEPPAALRVPADTGAPGSADDLAALAARFHAEGRLRFADTGDARCCRVRSAADARRVEREMLAALVRPTDGFFARHFDRHLSRRLSLVLVRSGVHPNWVTALATLVALLGAGLLASADRPLQVLGALVFIFATVLDGCDGEVARLSLRTSELGGKLDLIGDNIGNAAVFAAIGYASFRAQPTPLMETAVGLALGGLALATAAGFWYSRWLERSGRGEAARNTYESVVSRDFAYLILVLAAIGRLSWLVWATAVGSSLFALLVAVLRLNEWPRAAAPAAHAPRRERTAPVIASAPDGGLGP